MSNSMSDDYFSFMSAKWTSKHPAKRQSIVAKPTRTIVHSDTIDFVDDSQIEVIESFMTDTMTQLLFRHRNTG